MLGVILDDPDEWMEFVGYATEVRREFLGTRSSRISQNCNEELSEGQLAARVSAPVRWKVGAEVFFNRAKWG